MKSKSKKIVVSITRDQAERLMLEVQNRIHQEYLRKTDGRCIPSYVGDFQLDRKLANAASKAFPELEIFRHEEQLAWEINRNRDIPEIKAIEEFFHPMFERNKEIQKENNNQHSVILADEEFQIEKILKRKFAEAGITHFEPSGRSPHVLTMKKDVSGCRCDSTEIS